MSDCRFCTLKTEKEKILYEDDFIFIFHDIHKASSKEHILICPKEHIKNILTLDKNHIPLVFLMKKKALSVLGELDKNGSAKYRFSFS